MDQELIVKGIIDNTHKASKGSCGIYIAEILNQTKLTIEDLHKILRKLYSEKYFILREGLNGKLIFKKV